MLFIYFDLSDGEVRYFSGQVRTSPQNPAMTCLGINRAT